MTEPADLPDKLYFKIGEVAKLVGVKPYVLRYWETEFPSIRPGKTESKHRLYRRRDVETLIEIRRLLHDERYTIEGAKRRLRDRGDDSSSRVEAAVSGTAAGGDSAAVASASERSAEGASVGSQMALPLGDSRYREVLEEVRQELKEIRKLLHS